MKGETIGFEGWRMRVRLDEETLEKHLDPDARQILLRWYGRGLEEGLSVCLTHGSPMVTERKETEISWLFPALGTLLSVLADGISVVVV